MMSIKTLLIIILSGILASCTTPAKKSSQETALDRPNILFIMTDDHTRQAISLYGSSLLETPNIDRIGKEGIRYDRAFVTNSICAPSRAVLLTGKYSHLNGLRDNHDSFDTSQPTFPKYLKQQGYQTSLIGKWHLKNHPTGFDYWNILPGQGLYYNPRMVEMGDTTEYTGYATDIITDLAIENLNKRDKNKPFCMLYHHKAPHRNWMPNTKHLDLFKDDEIPLPETFWDDYNSRTDAAREQDMRIEDMYLSLDMKLQKEYYGTETGTGGHPTHNPEGNWEAIYERFTPEQRTAWDAHYQAVNEEFKRLNPRGKALTEWKYQRYIKDYLRCVVSVDENIGRMLDYLESEGILDNTVIVYTSDQGFYLGEHGWYDKRYMYEESFSTPLLIRYPKEIPAGQTSAKLVMNLDFAPTFMDYANVQVPEDMQGLSLRRLNAGEAVDDWRESVYYHYYQSTGWHHVPKHYGVRNDRYKLIHYYEKGDWELYDLEEDPNELQNLYENAEYEATIEGLRGELSRLQVQYNDPIHTENPSRMDVFN